MSLAPIAEYEEESTADPPFTVCAQEDDEERDVILLDGRVTCASMQWFTIPPSVQCLYGPRTIVLDLSSNCLRLLKGLECFSLLQELILDDNQLADDVSFPRMNRLHTLSLNKNRLTKLDSLLIKLQVNLPKIRFLSLLHNPLCPDALCTSADRDELEYQRYRLRVVGQIAMLRFLDSSAVTDQERKLAQAESLRETASTAAHAQSIRESGENSSGVRKGSKYTSLSQLLTKSGKRKS